MVLRILILLMSALSVVFLGKVLEVFNMEGHKFELDEVMLERGKRLNVEHVKPFGKLDVEKVNKLTPLKKD